MTKKHPAVFSVETNGIRLAIGEWSKILTREEAIKLLRGLSEMDYPEAARILAEVEAIPCG